MQNQEDIEIFTDDIGNLLKSKITDKKNVFVFTTDVVCQSWADWCVTENHTAVKSVASSRFLAWDTFKGEVVSAQKEGYSAVPSVLRKLFAHTLIQKNAENQIFKKIINPYPEYRKDAFAFADWISKNLPSLHVWKKRLEKNREIYGELDDEDEDYKTLYTLYSEFLEKNRLFEPGWIDEIKFTDEKHHYYIFYPEQIEDFVDYIEIFKEAGNVSLVYLPKAVNPPKCYEFSDSRSELRKTILRIVGIVNSGKADWTQIALTVPDFETYRPYLKRELELYSVPFVFRAGEPLSKNCAGRIFKEISGCHENEFSFDSVRALLLDETVPWKKEIQEIKENLIREGNRMRCICPFEEKTGKAGGGNDADGNKNLKTEKIDVWEKALLNSSAGKSFCKNASESNEILKSNELLNFYRKLKRQINLFFDGDADFSKILSSWIQFREIFLETNDFENAEFENSNRILARCVTQLKEIIEVEKTFKEQIQIKNPFDFFMNLLDEKSYTPQQKSEGVSVFDYKLSASACFKFQFVINASQKQLDIQKKRLGFLSREKREKLGFLADDLSASQSDVTAKLYARETGGADGGFVHFSYAIDSFSGFSIPHSSLENLKSQPENLISDYILAEKNWILGGGEEKILLTEKQKISLENWKNSALEDESKEIGKFGYFVNGKIKENVGYVLKKSRENLDVFEFGGSPEHIKISARGDMEQFFPCPRKWVLKKILRLQDDSLDTRLMQNYDMGNLNHKILEKFMSDYEGKNLPWYDAKNGCFMGESLLKDEKSDSEDESFETFGNENSENEVSSSAISSSESQNPGESNLAIKNQTISNPAIQNHENQNPTISNLENSMISNSVTLDTSVPNPNLSIQNQNPTASNKAASNQAASNLKILNKEPQDVTSEIKKRLYNEIVHEAIHDRTSDFRDLPLVLFTLDSQKTKIADAIFEFLKVLLLPFGEYSGRKGYENINGVGKCAVLGVEKTFAANFKDFDLFGKIDCLLKSADGEVVILDYKNTSASIPSSSEIAVSDEEILQEFQMPFYANLVSENIRLGRLKGELFASYFYAIKDKTKTAAFDDTPGSKKTISDFGEAMSVSLEYAELFKSKVENYDFAPKALRSKKDRLGVSKYEDCARCQFKTICRTTYTVGEKTLETR